MPDVGFHYVLLGGLAIALLIAAYTDIRSRLITNHLNIAIACGAPLFWLASGLGWTGVAWQLGIALATFVVLTGLFMIRAMGGGDVKLLTALALWIQPLWFLRLLVVMALVGGVLTVALWVWHAAKGRKDKLAVPYGVAISIAGLWVLVAQHLPKFMPLANAGTSG
jgi:prepilin peptidase CpaA